MNESPSSLKQENAKSMKQTKLAPSKSTAYVSNLPFSLTNNDLFKIFSKFGNIVKVTVLKDKVSGKSRGVAFVLFHEQEAAHLCVKNTNGFQMFGRTLRSNVAKDNGRASEFIKRKEYPDKSCCYECGETGHLSYACPNNILGERQPPPKKKKLKPKLKKIKTCSEEVEEEYDDEEEQSVEDDFDDSLSASIRYEQELREGELFLESQMTTKNVSGASSQGKKKMKQCAYFSDEDEED